MTSDNNIRQDLQDLQDYIYSFPRKGKPKVQCLTGKVYVVAQKVPRSGRESFRFHPESGNIRSIL